MGVGLNEGTPKALRLHLEQLAKHPPKTDFENYIEIVTAGSALGGYVPADIEDFVEDE